MFVKIKEVLLLLLLLLLATVTYNQVQSFQVNDYANHNVDIEITGYRELYSINCKQQCLHVYMRPDLRKPGFHTHSISKLWQIITYCLNTLED